MATKVTRNVNGTLTLKAALAALIQSQATLVQTQAQAAAEMIDLNRRSNELKEETARRFSNIETLLLQHDLLLKALPETIKEKIGFNKR
jgi:hypothetical protein